MAIGEWFLCDDSKSGVADFSERVDRGPETAIKAKYHDAIRTGKILGMNAYLEDPEGNQFEWNTHTSMWVQIG